MSDPAPQKTPISGCVICYQEADRIEDCIRSLAFCDEVVVVDSGSTDGTPEKAAALGARVITNAPFPGYRAQKQLAVDLARYDWVFLLDADERVTPALRERIEQLRTSGLTTGGFSMPRRNHYLGRMVRGGVSYPDRKMRFFDRRVTVIGGRDPHDRMELLPGHTVVPLREPIEHLSYRDFEHHLRTIDRFSRISAEAMHAEGRKGRWIDIVVRPTAIFLKSLILKRGFIDGWRGVAIAAMSFRYDWIKYRRLWRLSRGLPIDPPNESKRGSVTSA